MKIETLVGLKGYTLIVYRGFDYLYRFSIIDFSGILYNFDSIFLTAQEANQKGREAVELAFDFDLKKHQF